MKGALLQGSVLLAVLVMSSAVAGQSIVCPTSSQQFVTTNRDLLPLEGIVTEANTSAFSPLENLVKLAIDSPWCTTPATNSHQLLGQHIVFNFTEPVRVSMIVSSGYINGYVNNFTIEYTESMDDDDYVTYTVAGMKYFHVEELETFMNVHFILEEAIVARRIRLSIIGNMLDDLNRTCWKIHMFGCAVKDTVIFPVNDNDVSITPAPTSLPSSSAPICPPLPSTTPSGMGIGGTVLATDCNCSGSSQGELLAIVLPVAMVTVLVNLIAVVAGVAICLRYHKNRRTGLKEGYETVTLKVLNNGTGVEKPVQLYHPAPRRRIMSDASYPASAAGSAQSRESSSTLPGKLLYDTPRTPALYDVPRSASVSRSRSRTETTPMEFPNALYDVPPSDDLFLSQMEDADYDEIPEKTPGGHTHARITAGLLKPPLPLPNRQLSNGVSRSRATSPGNGGQIEEAPSNEENTAAVPPTYAVVQKDSHKDKPHPPQQPIDSCTL